MKPEEAVGGKSGPVFAISINLGDRTMEISGNNDNYHPGVEGTDVDEAETVE